jgi:catechol 2,3-dioxygenase-like lactoylglutathione lyase family enzyme
MPVEALDHVNIRTGDVARTIGFFRDALRMEVVPPPGRTATDEAAWVLDDKGSAVVHIGSLASAYPTDSGEIHPPPAGSGAVHHVALNCSGYDEMKRRLAELGFEMVANEMTEIGLRQLFITETNGILFELNFWKEAG